MVYLDNAATTPVRPEVIKVISNALEQEFGNASSIYRIGKHSKLLLNQARTQIANSLGISSQNIYFTSGATESNNWAIKSQALKSLDLNKGNHIVVTAIEHPSVRETLKAIEEQGISITWLYPNKDGSYLLKDFLNASKKETVGWVTMAVNNEVGSILPIKELGNKAKELGLWFHVDGVQAIGHLDTEIIQYATSFSISAHKFNGPKGIGLLIYQPWDKQLHLNTYIHGGGQELGKRSGTENLPYILGMAEALDYTLAEQDETIHHYQELADYLYKSLQTNKIEYEVNGDALSKSPHIHSLWIKGVTSSQLLIHMDLADIYLSAGSACSAGSLEESKVLKAYYPDQPKRWSQSIRLSFGYQTTFDEIDQFIKQLMKVIERNF